MKKVVTFGEIMMRLNPFGYKRFIQSEALEISYAGGEANVAVSLANYNQDAYFVTKVPSNDFGSSAINALRRYGVNTNFIVRGGDRLGIYFVEKGASQRASKVIYDRANSSIAKADIDDFNWKEILKGASWFHFTGITAALGGNNPEICLKAAKTAKEMGVKVSCDLNYRNKLWSREEANKVMSKLMKYVDLCISNEEDAYDVFQIKAEGSNIYSGKIDNEGYISVAKQIHERFGCEKVAITLRGSISASVNEWSAMLYSNQKAYFAPKYNIQIVDRVGGGDSFGGALIYAQLEEYDNQMAINFATAASCLKHSIEGDFNLVSLEEIKALTNGDASGRVKR